MQRSRKYLFGYHRTWASFYLALVFCFSSGTSLYGQTTTSSDPSSSQSSDPWQTLKSLADNLPNQINSYNESLQAQIQSLQTKVGNLQSSNESLTANVTTLQRQNRDLQASLSQSRAKVEASKQQLATLQTSLMASMQSTKAAQRRTNAQSFAIKALVVVGSALAVYSGGHLLHLW